MSTHIKTSFLFYTFTLFLCLNSFFIRNTAAQASNELISISASYTFETIDVPDVDYLAVTASSDFEDYAGYTKSADGQKMVGFTRIDGVFTTHDFPGAQGTYFYALGNNGLAAGHYEDSDGLYHGVILENGEMRRYDFPDAVQTEIYGYSDATGALTGNFIDASGVRRGFSGDRIVEYPGATETYAEFVDARGLIVGSYVNADGVYQAYVLAPDGTFLPYSFPGAENLEYIFVHGMNDGIGIVTVKPVGSVPITAAMNPTLGLFELKFPGSVSTEGWNINQDGSVVGHYDTADGRRHGFIARPIADPAAPIEGPPIAPTADLHYTFESIDIPGVDFLAVTASSDLEGYAGYTKSADGQKDVAFTLIDGVFMTYEFPGSQHTYFYALGNNGNAAGHYQDSAGHYHGVILENGALRQYDFPGAVQTFIYGIRDATGALTGNFIGADGVRRGFSGNEIIEVPGAAATYTESVASDGRAVGSYVNADGIYYPYERTSDGTFLPILLTGTEHLEYLFLPGVNDARVIVGRAKAVDSFPSTFVLDAHYGVSELKFPGSVSTEGWNINQDGSIVGHYDTADGRRHGFIARPPNAPVFNEGSSTTRSIAENTNAGVDIGSAVSATDDNEDTLSYSLSFTDAAAFSIDSSTGQLKTSSSLNYETKSTYSVFVNVSDGQGGSASISVTINVTDVNEAPVLAAGDSITLTVSENTGSNVNIGSALSATDPDDGDTLTYSLGGTDAASFSIDSTTGQLRTRAALDYENKNSYTVTVSVSDGKGGSDSISVTINVTDVNENRAPTFNEGTSATRAITENAGSNVNIGSAVSATDPDSDTLTYSLGGTDAASFSIVSTSGQLRTSASLDYENKNSYTVTVSVSDGKGGSDSISVTINVTDVNETPANTAPVFTDGTSTTRSVAENTGSGVNIGSAISATDADSGDTLTYTLGGTDAASFSIVSTSGQLQTSAALDYENKNSYTVTVSVSDGKGGSDSISVTINVTDVDETPANTAPVFTDGTSTTRSVAENTGSGVNIGSAVSATDADSGDTLTYTLGGTDAASFSIISTSGQLRTSASLDYENKNSYTVIVSVSDGNGGSDSITVTINVTDVNENRDPVFTEGASATRSIAENTGSGVDIGSAVSATDADSGDTLTYTLGGTDASSFAIVSTSGQLQTNAALDYETKTSYSVTVSVSDSNGGTDSITVTINITNVNEAPVFSDGSSTTRSIAENTAAGQNVGTAVAATDVDTGDTLTYTLVGTDAASFSIVSTSGQLQTKAALDYETKTSYLVTVSVSDGNGGSDSISVTINVTDVSDSVDVSKPGVSITVPSGVQNDEFDVTITFTEPVSDFEQSDVSVTGTADGTITEWSANTEKTVFTAQMMPTESGEMILTVEEGVATDNADNPNTASAAQQIEIDITQPDVSFSFDLEEQFVTPVSYITNGPFEMTITFTEPVSGFEQSDLEIDDDYTYSDFKAVGAETIEGTSFADTYTVQVIPDPNDDSLYVRIHIEAGVATDAAGNPNTHANSPRIRVEKFRPRVEISVPDADVTTATFTIEIKFDGGNHRDDRPLGFEQSDLSLTNNTAGATITKWTEKQRGFSSSTYGIFQGGYGAFEAEITVTQSGNVTFSVAENVATDLAGNGNTAATQKTVTIVLPGAAPPVAQDVDTTPPSISFSFDLEEQFVTPVSYITNGPFKMTITFTEPVSGFEQSDLEIDDDYTYSDFKAVGAETIEGTSFADTYTVQVIPDPNDDSLYVRIHIEAGVATDAAGNPNTYANSPRIRVEKFRPRVEISVPDADVTTATFTIEIKFDGGNHRDDRPLGFEQSDLSLTNNTAGATITKWTEKQRGFSSSTYGIFQGGYGAFEAEITVTQSGQVTFGVAENVATDLAGNGNTAATQKTVTIVLPGAAPPVAQDVDTTPPSISFSFDLEEQFVTPVSYITNGPFEMTITFTEPVSGFEQSDLEIDDDYTYSDFKAVDAETIEGTSFADTYTVQVIPDPNDDSLYVRIHIEAGVATDAAGNPNTHANSPRIRVEKFRPRVEISVPDADVTTATFTIEIKFDGGNHRDDRPLGFEQSDLSLTNNTAGATITKWTEKQRGFSSSTYGIFQGGYGAFEAEITVTQSGQVTFGVAENVATDLAGNGNTAATQKTVTIALPNNERMAPLAKWKIDETQLLANFPNPFNPETWIPYQLAKPAAVTITVFDVRGRVVRTLILGNQPAGLYRNRSKAAHWDGRNAFGEKVAAGMYFYTLKAGDFSATRKMLIRK